MQREEKAVKVQELHEVFSRAKLAVTTDYRGLKVADLEKLRRSFRQADTELRIAKNTFLRIATRETSCEALSDSFTGTTAVAVGFADPVTSAKILMDFVKEFPGMSIRSGVLDGKLLSAAEVDALAKLPGQDELRAQFLGVLAAVPTGLVRVLSGVPRGFLYALKGIQDKKEQ
ncbi:MAG: 50S ribosomal protein L10 [Desulfobulbaceae bacterium A2]|nr:MAG: 50S ribosomal protein L10 [Desulfobulbaceae bacterium A2]